MQVESLHPESHLAQLPLFTEIAAIGEAISTMRLVAFTGQRFTNAFALLSSSKAHSQGELSAAQLEALRNLVAIMKLQPPERLSLEEAVALTEAACFYMADEVAGGLSIYFKPMLDAAPLPEVRTRVCAAVEGCAVIHRQASVCASGGVLSPGIAHVVFVQLLSANASIFCCLHAEHSLLQAMCAEAHLVAALQCVSQSATCMSDCARASMATGALTLAGVCGAA